MIIFIKYFVISIACRIYSLAQHLSNVGDFAGFIIAYSFIVSIGWCVSLFIDFWMYLQVFRKFFNMLQNNFSVRKVQKEVIGSLFWIFWAQGVHWLACQPLT